MGTVVISVDAELGWGYHDYDTPPTSRIEAGRNGWSTLVDLFDRFETPATWAIVGHLFLEDCDGEHGDHPAPENWFRRERSEWRSRPDLRFGGGLIEDVEDAEVDHEIASHSFSHVRFDESETSSELASAELEASVELARRRGIELESFVFPRNEIGHRNLLSQHGFRYYRGKSPANRHQSQVTKSLLRIARGTGLGDELLLVEPEVDEYGLVNVPASMYLYSFEGTVQDVCAPIIGDPIVKQAERGIELAARQDGLFHMWLHPNNLHREYTVERLRSILEYLAARRDDGGVSVKTMADIAERVLEVGATSRESACGAVED